MLSRMLVLALAQQRVSDITRSELEAREKAIALRTELQSESIVAQLGVASNAKLNIAPDRAENAAYQESQEFRNEAAVAVQYKYAASFLDLQKSSLRARSTGLDSNPTGPDAGHIAHDVLAARRPDQEQIARDQKIIDEQLSQMAVAQRETLDSQRNAFVTEVHRMRCEIQESIHNSHPTEQLHTSWRSHSPAYIHTPSLPIQPFQP